MFDIGFWELLLLAVIGLLVLGPERLPRAIRSVQRMSQRMKAFSSRMEAEINHELRVKELHENLKKIESSDTEELSPELKRSLEELQAAAESVRRPYSKEKSAKEKSAKEKSTKEKSAKEKSAKKSNAKEEIKGNDVSSNEDSGIEHTDAGSVSSTPSPKTVEQPGADEKGLIPKHSGKPKTDKSSTDSKDPNKR